MQKLLVTVAERIACGAGEHLTDFTIRHRGPDGEDFRETGFGSSAARESADAAVCEAGSAARNRVWGTAGDRPAAEDVDKDD